MCVLQGAWDKDEEGHTIGDIQILWLGIEFMGADFSFTLYKLQTWYRFFFLWNDEEN